MKIHRVSLIVIVILALIGITTSCEAVTPISTFTSTPMTTKTLPSNSTYTPMIEPSPNKTTSPLPMETINPVNGIEVIVYTWDWPMMANIPPIHIWKDGYALWVLYGKDNLTHVYETYLSQGEIIKVQGVLSNSGFWEEAQPNASFTQASYLFLWASKSFQEGVVAVTTSEMSDKLLTPLQNILESSPNKREYFPVDGYLSISDDGIFSENTYSWPDDKITLKFDDSFQEVYVDGEVISTVWEAIQQNAIWVASQENAYRFQLKIPGASCVISYEPYMCNMYSVEKQ